MGKNNGAIRAHWDDVWLLDGVRTGFADFNGVLGLVSPIDMGIKAAREVFTRAGVEPGEVGTVICGSVAQASFDAFLLPRHIGLYSGVPKEVPAHLVHRVCGTGIEAISQAADAVSLGRADVGLTVGSESMSRNPIAAYTHRGGFKLGQLEFKDFLWEATLDTSCNDRMGDTAENLAKKYGITREEVDRFACQSFSRALAARESGFFDDEIIPVVTETFECDGYQPRGLKLPRGVEEFKIDDHVRPSPLEKLAKIRPAFGGVQTGGNSSAIVDGAAAALIASGSYVRQSGKKPLGRVAACATVGVPPEIMGIGPAPAIRALLEATGLSLADIGRIEINEAFGAQVLACIRELSLDAGKLNVNGGAIAIGHPLGASGARILTTLVHELNRRQGRYGLATMCIGVGQGISTVIERV
jgi:acetyl-CoA C-acetyltransferase